MKKTIIASLILLSGIRLNAQIEPEAVTCPANNYYTEIHAFTEASSVTKIYKTYLTPLGTKNLKMNIWVPVTPLDEAKKPLLLMIHGGAFQTGSRNDQDNICKEFALRGFVAVTIDYRKGWNCNNGGGLHQKAVYMALQDAYSALEYLYNNRFLYKINTNAIFVGGSSAGAITALNTVYMEQSEADVLMPGASALLGPLKSSTYPNLNIKGIFNNWGGIDASIFDNSEAVPMISFHGSNDGVVPYEVNQAGPVCDQTTIWGSKKIYDQIQQNVPNVCLELYERTGGVHGVWQDPDSTLMRISRTACFFRSIICLPGCSGQLYSTVLTNPVCSTSQLSLEEPAGTEVELIQEDKENKQISLAVTSPTSGFFHVSVYNSSGILLHQSESRIDTERTVIPVDFSTQQLPSGIYLIQWNTGSESGTEKIFIP